MYMNTQNSAVGRAYWLTLLASVAVLAGCGGSSGSDNVTAISGVQLSIADAAADETDAGNTSLVFNVTLSESAAEAVTADYATLAETASAGSDYVAASGQINIAAGETSGSIEIAVLGDQLDEDDETFGVTLSNPSNNAVLLDAAATGTIRDDDSTPLVEVSIADAAGDETDAGEAPLAFAITLSGSSADAVTFDYATVAISATAGSDFIAENGQVSIAAGQTAGSIEIAVVGDLDDEPDETFRITLSNPSSNATLLDATATGTIRDNDSGQSVFGLAQRPGNTSCLAPPRPGEGASVSTEDPFPASPGFDNITKILQAPDDDSRWFVLEQAGRVRVFDSNDPGNPRTYIDITDRVRSGGEEGLLGMAFHPDFPGTAEIYLYYLTGSGNSATRKSRIVRLTLDDTDDPQSFSEDILIIIDQFAPNHNGGDIAFGPDNFLYIGLGDGGGGGDPNETGQDTTNLLGSMLRIDVLGVPFPSPGYQVPGDNPFADQSKCGSTRSNPNNCPEIYAWGLRNPWRWSFDAETEQLWAGDVGQDEREEISLIELGGNYGWDCREGSLAYESTGCAGAGFIEPVSEYPHTQGNASITGGYVYRGSEIPELIGRYVFADYVSGRIWALQDDNQGGYVNELLIDTPWLISAFARGEDGELYFADRSNERLRRLTAGGGGNPDTIPDDLADTGCVDANNPALPAEGLVPYATNAPFWSDNAEKSRWLAIPDGSSITLNGDGDFDLPNGSVIVKNFSLSGQLIETRLLMRHPDGVWGGYTYEWNASETAATRVRGGKVRTVGGQDWIYPSEGECLQCHTSAAGFSLGPEVSQLNGDIEYPSTGITANQLTTLEHIDFFSAPLSAPAGSLPAMPDPFDNSAGLDERARAYLHTNCAQCHRPGGPTPSSMDLRYTTALSATNACDEAPASGRLGIGSAARLISPGNSQQSVIPARMSRRDAQGMPPLGSSLADTAGVALIDSWINSLQNCN